MCRAQGCAERIGRNRNAAKNDVLFNEKVIIMSYTRKYLLSDFGSETLRRAAARRDVKRWLGTKRFNKLASQLVRCYNKESTKNHVTMVLGIAGIQGYPVTAMMDSYLQPVTA